MYVCNCNGLTLAQIEEAVDSGVSEPHEALEYHNCRPRCCGCLNSIGYMIKDREERINVKHVGSEDCEIVARVRAGITTS